MLLRNMAKHENLESILHLRVKKYMWLIYKCNSLRHCKTGGALPIYVLHSRNLPTFPPENHLVCHACIQMWAKLAHHSVQTSLHSLPPIRLLFTPPLLRHTSMSASHLRLRMNCAAAEHCNLTFPFPFALSLFNLPFVTVFASMQATSRIG